VIKDIKRLKGYIPNNHLDIELKRRIYRRIRELKKKYTTKICSLIRHAIDIPMVLRFIGLSFIPHWLASLLGTSSSAISLYTMIKFE